MSNWVRCSVAGEIKPRTVYINMDNVVLISRPDGSKDTTLVFAQGHQGDRHAGMISVHEAPEQLLSSQVVSHP